VTRGIITGFGQGPNTLIASPGKFGYLAPSTVALSPGSSTPPSNTQVFPFIGVQAQSGTQSFTNSTNVQALAKYQWIMLGGNYTGWPSANGYSGTRDATVLQLKSYTGLGGPYAVLPLVGQYDNLAETPTPDNGGSPWFTEWYTVCNNNNWWVWNSGSSGTHTQSAFQSTWYLANPAHVVGTDSGTGLYPYQYGASLMYQRYHQGTGSGGSAMASTHLDFYLMDNHAARNLSGSSADWLRNGTNPSQTDPTATQATSGGKADWPTYMATLNPNIKIYANTEFGYDFGSASYGGLGMSTSGMTACGKYAGGMSQFVFGSPEGVNSAPNNVLQFGGLLGFINWYQALQNNLAPGAVPVLTGQINSGDYQSLRYSLTATLMGNGVFVAGNNTNGGINDIVDPGNQASWCIYDEFWGGSLNTAGYLGVAVDPFQTGPWLQGVWKRTYANGIALCNPAGNGTQTVSLGGTYTRLNGSQVPSINSGATATSVTIPAGDGIILLG
jgi:hypothetical protein